MRLGALEVKVETSTPSGGPLYAAAAEVPENLQIRAIHPFRKARRRGKIKGSGGGHADGIDLGV